MDVKKSNATLNIPTKMKVGLVFIFSILIFIWGLNYLISNTNIMDALLLGEKPIYIKSYIFIIALTLIFMVVYFLATKKYLYRLLLKDKYNEIEIEVSPALRTALQKYLVFFKEYLATIKGINITINVNQSEKGIVVQIKKNNKQNSDLIKEWLREYTNFIFSKNIQADIKFSSDTGEETKDLFTKKILTQISQLKEDIDTLKGYYGEQQKQLEEFKATPSAIRIEKISGKSINIIQNKK